MDSLKPINVKFRLEKQVVEELIIINWSIGKVKGKIRKRFKINPYYILELIYNGQVLENTRQFKEVNYQSNTFIKVMANRQFLRRHQKFVQSPQLIGTLLTLQRVKHPWHRVHLIFGVFSNGFDRLDVLSN